MESWERQHGGKILASRFPASFHEPARGISIRQPIHFRRTGLQKDPVGCRHASTRRRARVAASLAGRGQRISLFDCWKRGRGMRQGFPHDAYRVGDERRRCCEGNKCYFARRDLEFPSIFECVIEVGTERRRPVFLRQNHPPNGSLNLNKRNKSRAEGKQKKSLPVVQGNFNLI